MDAAHFFQRAAQEGRRYGQDPLVFLRELSQNARDARAREISVSVDYVDGHQRIQFRDDGLGMALEHARAYLFRLYASSKEDDESAAGHFGVGFWSVLLWEPSKVVVESAHPGGAWRATVDPMSGDSALEETMLDGGTRVTLLRAGEADPELEGNVAYALSRYCRYLRCLHRDQERVAISVNGRRVDEPLDLPGPLTLSFRKRGIQGVIGLAETPRVELFARGLLVKKVTVLEELVAERLGGAPPQFVGGLSPVIIINSDDLDVVMSRQSPLEGKALERLMRLAERRLQSFIKRVADRVCPVPWSQRLRDAFARGVEAAGGAWVVASLLATLTMSAAIFLVVVPPGVFGPRLPTTIDDPAIAVSSQSVSPSVPTSADRRLRAVLGASASDQPAVAFGEEPRTYQNIQGYQGPRIDDVGAAPQATWKLRYRALGGSTPKRMYFKALTLGEYDTQKGWVRGETPRSGRYKTFRCRKDCIEVTLAVDAPTQDLVVPLPTGYRLDTKSLTLDDVKLRKIYTNRYAEPLIRTEAGGMLRYRAGPVKTRSAQVGQAPNLPAELRALVASADSQSRVARGIDVVSDYIADRVEYDVSAKGARAFDDSAIPWIEKVLDESRGDCDVKNGLNVAALRNFGVPAQLAVGIPAAQGFALPGLHAWTEYHLRGRWRQRDVSLGGSDAPVASISAPPAVTSSGIPSVSPGSGGPPSDVRPLTTERRIERSNPEVAAPTDAAPPVASSPQPEEWEVGGNWFVLILLLVLAALAGVSISLLRRMTREDLRESEDGVAEQRALARILKDALSQPMSWRAAGNLWYRRLLPTLGGTRISVAEAAERSARGGLWLSTRHSELARAASDAGTPVLDGSDEVFGEVIRALGRAADIDAIDPLRPTGLASDALRRMLGTLHEVLTSLGSDVRVVPCEGLLEHELRDVDLSRAKVPRKSPWLKRYVAFHPHSPELRQLEAISDSDPERGQLLFTEWLVTRSDLLAERRNLIRERAAKRYLYATEASS